MKIELKVWNWQHSKSQCIFSLPDIWTLFGTLSMLGNHWVRWQSAATTEGLLYCVPNLEIGIILNTRDQLSKFQCSNCFGWVLVAPAIGVDSWRHLHLPKKVLALKLSKFILNLFGHFIVKDLISLQYHYNYGSNCSPI